MCTEYGHFQSKSLYSVQMRENTDQKNSKYGHFLHSVRKIVGKMRVLICPLKLERKLQFYVLGRPWGKMHSSIYLRYVLY